MNNRSIKTLQGGKSAGTGSVRRFDSLGHTRDMLRSAIARIPRHRTGIRHASRAAPRVLLLTSNLGHGHVRTAQAIEQALAVRAPQAIVETLDFWSLMDERVAHAVRETYLRLVKERPELYDRIYDLDQRTWRKILESNDTPPAAFADVIGLVPAIADRDKQHELGGRRYRLDRALFPALCAALAGRPRRLPQANWLARFLFIAWCWSRLAQRLRARVLAFRPDVIVATQMNPAALLSSVKKGSGLDTPTIGVLTDFGVHDFWIQPGIDHYCVAHESMIADLRAAGIEAQRVSVTGMPLMPGFRNPPSKAEARRSLGLEHDLPVVVVPGGGLGLGVIEVTKLLLERPGRMQVLVIAGHNVSARAALSPFSARYGSRLRVWDWTDQIEHYLCAADVVAGKPGGLTVAETLACGRPLLATGSLRGQEDFNVDFIQRHGIGRLVPVEELSDAVETLLGDTAGRARIENRALELGRRDGAENVAGLICELAHARAAAHLREAS